jgi:hypothetical protein
MALNIGMAVPGASSLMGAAPSLGDQVAGESEEARKRRLLAMQTSREPPTGSSLAAGYGAALGLS